jgi:hypothetical protein
MAALPGALVIAALDAWEKTIYHPQRHSNDKQPDNGYHKQIDPINTHPD